VLARLLVGAPDLLLLDEPTTHLDLEAIDWLEQFLETYEGAFVVVSHDRYFLNRMVRGVVELDRGQLATYTGTYDDYLAAKQTAEAAREKAAKQ
ncbi:ABC transporter ATP-binding protein, partial [Klebsiella pneumoniae]|nr:ABC transporter ATP-binding protein [Klebsiella pneumoniae]MDA4062921.1 ABC transporter ATP-binding protein [Klebsiella pneumoniae]